MSTRCHEAIDQALAQVPDRGGDLEAVRGRAHQRTTRRRGIVVGLAVLVVGAVTAVTGMDRMPDVPVIGSDHDEVVVQIQTCAPPEMCPWGAPDHDEFRAALEDDPAIEEVAVLTPEDVREGMSREIALLEEAAEGSLPVVYEATIDPDADLLETAHRLWELSEGGSVRVGRLHEAPIRPTGEPEPLAGFEPDEGVGERVVLSEGDASGLPAWEAWPVAGGGVCFEVDGARSCHRNLLLTMTSISPEQGAWSHLDDGSTCMWGITGLDTEDIEVTFTDADVVAVEVAERPAFLLGRPFMACSNDGGVPTAIEATGVNRSSSHEGGLPHAVFPEAEPPATRTE